MREGAPRGVEFAQARMNTAIAGGATETCMEMLFSRSSGKVRKKCGKRRSMLLFRFLLSDDAFVDFLLDVQREFVGGFG